MPARYKVIEKVNPQDRQGPRKYYPSLQTDGRSKQRDLALEAADRSTLSDADMDGSMTNLLNLIPKHLADGKIVDLGEFGTFRLTISTEGAATAEEVTVRNIKKVGVRFTPGPAFKKMLDDVVFEKAK
ncbi:MAG: HU family DNA-binding protein [Ardenticatenaceae bacterium]|nr:HU family DNA-binding protein [Anaerolineales bacterium]MCB8921891.1 HU family DNA-binding protein [Ardenticatenaceae bacterium]